MSWPALQKGRYREGIGSILPAVNDGVSKGFYDDDDLDAHKALETQVFLTGKMRSLS